MTESEKSDSEKAMSLWQSGSTRYESGDVKGALADFTALLDLPEAGDKITMMKELLAGCLQSAPDTPQHLNERACGINPFPKLSEVLEQCSLCGSLALGLGMGAYVFHSKACDKCSCEWHRVSLKCVIEVMGSKANLVDAVAGYIGRMTSYIQSLPKVQSIQQELTRFTR